MSLAETVARLAQNLAGWGSTGLNEAQTSQVIVLPVLQALGYDIWNPLEVAAQIHSGGGNAAYAPDFTLKLAGRICFVVEVKALNREFSANDTTQAVNYVNALGRRWAVLTNGKAWHFYDNQVPKPAAQKLELTVELRDARAAGHLERLLSRRVWEASDAEQALAAEVRAVSADIQRHLDLGKIEKKLQQEMQAGFTADEKGLARAVQLTLEPNERELAEESFGELAKRLLQDAGQTSDILKTLRESIEKAVPSRRKNRTVDVFAWLDEKKLDITSCRDLTLGIAEAMLVLGQGDKLTLYKTTDEYLRKDGKPYPAYEYRQLSDGRYLMLHSSAAEHFRRSRKMLEQLNVKQQKLRVVYRGETFYLP